MNSQDVATPKITEMLREWGYGRHEAFDELKPHVCTELHRQAEDSCAAAFELQPPNHGPGSRGIFKAARSKRESFVFFVIAT